MKANIRISLTDDQVTELQGLFDKVSEMWIDPEQEPGAILGQAFRSPNKIEGWVHFCILSGETYEKVADALGVSKEAREQDRVRREWALGATLQEATLREAADEGSS